MAIYVKDAAGNRRKVAGKGGGVSSFKGRIGAVTPQTGDYTAEMVGADPAGSAKAAEDAAKAASLPAAVRGQAGGVASLGQDGKVPAGELPAVLRVLEGTIGTAWTEDPVTHVKSQTVALAGVSAQDHARADPRYAGDGSAEGYAAFAEQVNQYNSCITNGYAETVEGGIAFHIFGEANTVSIPIAVEVS